MLPGAPICLAASGGDSALDVVVWVVAAAFWLISQMAAAKAKKAKSRPPTSSPSSPAAPPGGGESPTADELRDIFRRLGADIPATPPPPAPAPTAPRKPPTYAAPARPPMPPRKPSRKPAGQVQPELARRLARARQEAEQAAREAEAARIEANAIVPGVHSREGEHRALDTATRHTGAILPRLYAMGLRLAPLPVLPMPGFGPPHRGGAPIRTRLHSRRDVRDAWVVQTFLQPPKSLTR